MRNFDRMNHGRFSRPGSRLLEVRTGFWENVCTCVTAGIILIINISVLCSCARYDAESGLWGLAALGDEEILNVIQSNPIRRPVTLRVAQSGVANLRNAATRIGISDVVTDRSLVFCDYSAPYSTHDHAASCELSAADAVEIRSAVGIGQRVAWKVLEFADDVQVQRGQGRLNVGELRVQIPVLPMGLGKAVPFVSWRVVSPTRNDDESRLLSVELLRPDLLQIERQTADVSVDFVWQLAVFENALVQSGSFTLGGRSQDIRIAPVLQSQSALFFSVSAPTALNGVEARYLVRGRLQDSTTLNFIRSDPDSPLRIVWYVVSMSGSRVQTGQVGYVNPRSLRIDVPIEAVDSDRALSFVSVSLPSPPGENSHFDAGSVRSSLINENTLALERQGPDNQSAAVNWTVIEFGEDR